MPISKASAAIRKRRKRKIANLVDKLNSRRAVVYTQLDDRFDDEYMRLVINVRISGLSEDLEKAKALRSALDMD